MAAIETAYTVSSPGLPCVHCGLCLDTCPTYRVLGVEADSPRGRIYIMEGVKHGELTLDRETTRHLDACLGCLACETACPSGVSYGERIDEFRPLLRNAPRGVRAGLRRRLAAIVAGNRTLLTVAIAVSAALERLGLARLRRRLPGLSLMPAKAAAAPSAPPATRARSRAPQTPRLRVALLAGCVADRLRPSIGDAAVEVLHRNGISVLDLPAGTCCGALAHHAGRRDEAEAHARRTAETFARMKVDALVTTAAGCGAMLRDYQRLLAGTEAATDGTRVAETTMDVSELLVREGFEAPASGTGAATVYHDACHLLHACGVHEAPRRVLEAATGTPARDLGENAICCGSAGSYNLDEPAMALTLGRRKAELVAASGASCVAVGNIGCLMQIERALAQAGIDAQVDHPIELLARAYRACDEEEGGG